MSTQTTEAPKRADLFKINPENIIIEEGFNIRVDYGDLKSLAISIKESGLKMPLRGYRSRENSNCFVLVDGHRRLKAIEIANEMGAEIKEVSFILEPKKYSNEERLLDMLLCNDGKNLTPLEESLLFKKLSSYGFSPKEIHEKSGRSMAQVYNLLDLANAPKKVHNLVTANKITEGAVIQIMKSTKNPEEQISLVEEAIENAKATGELTGKVKVATAKHVKSTDKVKTVLQILNEVATKIGEEGINTKSSDVFLEILEGAKKKKSVSALIKLFI